MIRIYNYVITLPNLTRKLHGSTILQLNKKNYTINKIFDKGIIFNVKNLVHDKSDEKEKILKEWNNILKNLSDDNFITRDKLNNNKTILNLIKKSNDKYDDKENIEKIWNRKLNNIFKYNNVVLKNKLEHQWYLILRDINDERNYKHRYTFNYFIEDSK